MDRLGKPHGMARVGEVFAPECPGCGGDIRLIASTTAPMPIRKIPVHRGSAGLPSGQRIGDIEGQNVWEWPTAASAHFNLRIKPIRSTR